VEDIAKSFREGDKALMVHGGANKAGRFLEVAVYVEKGWKGGLWLPEECDGWGWWYFAGELRRFLAPGGGSELPRMYSSSSATAVPVKIVEAGVTGDCDKKCSFVEALQSKPRAHDEVKNGGDMRSSVISDMGRSMQVAGSGRKTRGRADTAWVDELLGFAQLGLGRVVAGLLEGILDGPENLSVRNKVRAALKRLKGPKGFGFGPVSLPTSTGNTYGLCKGKPNLKGVGLGRLTNRVHLKPSHWIKAFTSEDRLGAFYAGVEPPVPEQGLGEALALPASTTDEGCLGASISDGLSSGAVPIPLASSLAATVATFPLGKEGEGRLGALENGCQAKDGSFLGAESSMDSEPTIPVSDQTTSVVLYSPSRDKEGSVLALAEFARNSAPAMGFLSRGFFGPRSPSLASSSLVCKDAPIKDKGTSAPVNGLICRGFFGSSPASSKSPVVTQVCFSSSKVHSSEASVSLAQLAYSRRVKGKVAKQLHKNKELLAESVGVSQVGTKGYSKAVLDAMKIAPVVGMTWGGEDNKMLEMIFAFDKRKPSVDVSTLKVKGLRELKNLDCTLSPVKC
jgi:hypothetical protein